MDNCDLETLSTRAGKRNDVKAWRKSTDINIRLLGLGSKRWERSDGG